MVPRLSTPTKTEEGKPGQISPLRKNLPQHAQDLRCAAKLTQREERRFIGPPRRALCQPKLGRENPAKFFRQGKTLPSAHRISHASQNYRNERNTVRLNSRHVLCHLRLRRENPARFFRRGKALPSALISPQKHLHPNFAPLLHLVPPT